MKEMLHEFATGLAEDLKKAGAPVTFEVALAASEAHLNGGMECKKLAMAVLVAAGVPMVVKSSTGTASLSSRIATLTYSVNGRTIFIGW